MTAFTDARTVQHLGNIPASFLPDWQSVESSALDLIRGGWDPESSVRSFEQPCKLPGMELVARYLPMMEVSGDYYGFLPLDKGQIGLAVGDACGKGIGAARLMASVYVDFQMRAQVCSSAGELLNYLNRSICHSIPEDQFVTFIYGVWDVEDETFTYSRAGHPPILHYRAATGHVHELSAGGMVLGVCEEVEYPTDSVSLEMGDVLVFYTDGIIEATDSTDEMFGIQRLTEVVAAYGRESSEALATVILDTASQFACKGWEDDVTLMIVKRDVCFS